LHPGQSSDPVYVRDDRHSNCHCGDNQKPCCEPTAKSRFRGRQYVRGRSPWLSAGDLDFPRVEGRRTLKVRVGEAYLAPLQYVDAQQA
jgi:hypothetical protein